MKLSDITKKFDNNTAVDGLSLSIHPGEIFGLLGPNGAGKSTTVNMAVGLLRPDNGTVSVGEYGDPSIPAVRRRIGVATQALAIYEELTAEENLRFFGQLFDLSGKKLNARVDWALEFVDLNARRKDRIGTYSGGMKRRINLACALIHDPELILLDEPTVGVDPQSRNAILDRVIALKEQGKTIVYTSHYMEEVERVCERVGIMDRGCLLTLGDVDALVATHAGKTVVIAETEAGEKRIEADTSEAAIGMLSDVTGVKTFRTEKADLETVFLNLTGRKLRD